MAVVSLAIAAPAHAAVQAQEYPTKPVRFIVASGPGGSTDGLARILANV